MLVINRIAGSILFLNNNHKLNFFVAFNSFKSGIVWLMSLNWENYRKFRLSLNVFHILVKSRDKFSLKFHLLAPWRKLVVPNVYLNNKIKHTLLALACIPMQILLEVELNTSIEKLSFQSTRYNFNLTVKNICINLHIWIHYFT